MLFNSQAARHVHCVKRAVNGLKILNHLDTILADVRGIANAQKKNAEIPVDVLIGVFIFTLRLIGLRRNFLVSRKTIGDSESRGQE